MPELPEVEVVRRGLAARILGADIESARVLDSRSIRRHTAGTEDFIEQITGATVIDVARRGKYLWLLLGDRNGEPADLTAVIHLGMSGQVLLKTADFPPEKHLRIVIDLRLAGGQEIQLRFVDQRIFGGIYLDSPVQVRDQRGLLLAAASRSELGLPLLPQTIAHIGRDPLDPHFSAEDFRTRVLSTGSAIKRVLLNQSVISGVGNIYADEALWRARIHYNKPARKTTASQTRQLVTALTGVLGEALAAGGTSFDALYVNVNGESGYFDRSLNVYGQEGKPCPRCLELGRNSLIVREPFMNRSSYRCPRCQPAPRKTGR